MLYLRVLGTISKKPLSYLKSTSSNLPCSKYWCKNKNPEIWDQKCLICDLLYFFTIILLEISVLKFVLLKSLVQK